MTDSFEFTKSVEPIQETTTPYVSKDWNSIPDINSGSYTNNSLTLVTFDLSSIYNSSRFTSISELYMAIPLVRTTALGTATAIVDPGTVLAPNALNILKPFSNLIHQADIQISNQTLEQTIPYLNKITEFQLLSQMSASDLANIGPSLGFSSVLDNPNSTQYNNIAVATASVAGNGVVNHHATSANTTPGTAFQQSLVTTSQNSGTINTALAERLSRNVHVQTATAVAAQNIYGTNGLMSAQQLNNELKPYFVKNGNFLIQYDTAIFRLKDIYDSIAVFPLCRKLEMTLRVYVNTGSIQVNVINPNLTTTGYYSSLTNSTFTNSCPFVIPHVSGTAANGGIPDTVTRIVSSLNIARTVSTSYVGIDLSQGNGSHPLSSCRIYYPSVQMKPDVTEEYVLKNRNKRVQFRTSLSSIYTAIPSGASFSQLVQSGVKNISGVVVLPFLDNSAGGSGSFPPGGSPFDTSLAHPLSLTNFNVKVGGVNMMMTPVQYGHDEFLQQVNLFESISNSDLSLSCGIITQPWWDINRVYFVDCSRGLVSDQMVARNVELQFTNNTNVAIQVLVYVLYNKEFTLDVESGTIQMK
jgi:hypothetical protein